MKPAWDKLMDEFKDSKTALVADVDCTVHQGLCGEYGVKGYPTIKYFSDGDWQDYSGGRDYDALFEFASTSLGPSCSYPDGADLCSEEQLTEMKEWAAKPDELKAEVAKLEAEVQKFNDDFDKALKELQENYKNLMSTRDDGVKAAKKPLGLLKSITV
jgi:thioredoxin-like negative regulator of GroEL